MKNTQGGQTTVSFGIATNREWSSNGEKKSSTEFHEVVAWAKLGEICHTYLRKGKLVYIEGYLKTRSWDTEDGDRRFRTEVVIQDMVMLEKRSGGDSQQPNDDDSEYLEAAPAASYDDDSMPEEGNLF